MSLTPKNWGTFQHYKDRKPPWIKLHRGLLDDYAFACLPVASQALAPRIWLLASEYEGGKITATLEEIAFRLHLTVEALTESLKPLVKSGFLDDASGLLAACKQSAMPEREREEETQEQKEEEKISPSLRSVTWPEGFLEFYAAYPKKIGKKDAAKAYKLARREVSGETILASLGKIRPTWGDPKYIPNPATWLRRGGFYDEPSLLSAPQRHGVNDPLAGII